MATYVHIADERDGAAIRRSGLRLPKALKGFADRPWGIFAMPLVPNYLLSHQWVREMKRRGFRVPVGVYFRVSDEEQVWAGLYNEAKQLTTAAQAAALLASKQIMGFEVIIPRSIVASEVRSIRPLPQSVGWRYFPDAHQRGIFCGCAYCQRGQIKARRIRDRYEAGAL